MVPIINLEWIQKLHRDKKMRGYSQEAVVDTILRRMPDYVNHIVPQFGVTHVNFQRVPTVDTSNPFIARDIPSADESMVIIRFTNPKGIDFPYLLSMLHDSAMTRPNTIIVPRRQDGTGDAADLHADDPAVDGHEASDPLAGSAGRRAMAAESAPAEVGSLAPEFELPGVCGQVWTRDACARAQRPAGDVHLQPLPIRAGGARPHRARCEGSAGARASASSRSAAMT